MNLEIRDLIEKDLDNASWTGGKRHIQYLKREYARTLIGQSQMLVAIADGEFVGIGCVDFEKTTRAGHIHMFNVKEGFRGAGIGSKMMDAFEESIMAKNLPKVELFVETHNVKAKQLYERRGYFVVRTQEETWESDAPGGGLEMYTTDVFVMEKNL